MTLFLPLGVGGVTLPGFDSLDCVGTEESGFVSDEEGFTSEDSEAGGRGMHDGMDCS